MAKSKNSTNKNQISKSHRNGIKKPKEHRHISTKGVRKNQYNFLTEIAQFFYELHLLLLKQFAFFIISISPQIPKSNKIQSYLPLIIEIKYQWRDQYKLNFVYGKSQVFDIQKEVQQEIILLKAKNYQIKSMIHLLNSDLVDLFYLK
ncbi:hypothetical protein ABPG73_015104 [Tetrahymena malaccensis]